LYLFHSFFLNAALLPFDFQFFFDYSKVSLRSFKLNFFLIKRINECLSVLAFFTVGLHSALDWLSA
jgi:hypothetical protein